VVNIGTEPVTTSFDVMLTGISHPGSDIVTIPVPPPVLPGGTVPVTLSFTVPPDPTGGAPCPINYELVVDSGFVIDECDELNNVVVGNVCCYGEPQQGACPDLTVGFRSAECVLNRKDDRYELSVEAVVTNSGDTTITSPIWVEADSVRGSDSNVIHTDMDPGDSVTTEFLITFPYNNGAGAICPITVMVEVDYVGFIVECDETNNEASGTACCD
jgi:hypothetical protein